MRCEDFPRCGHQTPPACLAARAADIPAGDEHAWLTAEEAATLEGLRRMANRADELHALCAQVAYEIKAGLRLLGVTLDIAPRWEGRPMLSMELADMEAARATIRGMDPQSWPQHRARHLLGLARSASTVTLGQVVSVEALQSIHRQARAIRLELEEK